MQEEINKYMAGQVLLFNKEANWTSFDVVNKVRNLIRKKYDIKKIKVGHAGTLDPLATGLVIVCTGKKTKTIEQYQAQEKEYIATIKLGETTPSFDLETEVDKTYPIDQITEESFKKAISEFIGKQEQMPPMFSAKRVNGKRAYISARKGKTLDLKPSKIEIYNIEIIKINLPYAELKITCSKGTYIRALARDIGTKLDSGAYLAKLIRTKIGDFSIKNALTIDKFEKML